MGDIDDIFEQEALWEGDSGSSFTADDRFVTALALARLLKLVTSSGSDFVNIVKGLVDEFEKPQAASASTMKEVERQKEFVPETEKVKKDALNNVGSFRVLVTAACMREVELVSNASAASDQMEKATAELRQTRNTISMQSKELATVTQLK